jgi:precorrin-6A/cobalt-precorrin-6A reductase
MIAPAFASEQAMPEQQTILILGGTGEARTLADKLVETYPKTRIITSLAGRTSSPRLPGGEIREGGFGGADGLATYLINENVDLMIDATHPYAAQISAHAADAVRQTGVPPLALVRAPWSEQPGDRWIRVPDMAAAVQEISRKSDVCLITTGVKDLEAFASIVTTKLFVRLIEQPAGALPLPDAEVVIGKPPYKLDEERALMQLLGIDLLVTKNAGGDGTRGKIDAARDLGIEVIMIDRPAMPDVETVGTVDAALTWIAGKLA